MKTDLIEKAYLSKYFREEAYKLIDRMAACMDQITTSEHNPTISWTSPEEQLKFWENDMKQQPADELDTFWKNVFTHSINNHSRGYMGHQLAVTPALTVLTGAAISFLNNSTTVYEIGMTANAMEKTVLNYLAEKFGYAKESTGVVTSGGSLGNLTALITARTSSGVSEKDYSRLAIIVSEEAHYSVARAAEIMGIPSENIWFHVDGAHGAAVVFSDKYRYLINGIERSDSLVMDFHKMLMAPAISTAVIYNSRKRKINEFSLSAAYLWQNQQSEEWYNSAKHTLECTKPITILHTYAILKRYGDELYNQHVTYLYDLGREFAAMVSARDNFELEGEPESNIVCFRYVPLHSNLSEDEMTKLNKDIYQKLIEDGEFYIVNTTLKGKFYLRVSLMNPLTQVEDIKNLLDKIEKIADKMYQKITGDYIRYI